MALGDGSTISSTACDTLGVSIGKFPMRNPKSECKKLHIGCGLNTPADWLNVDGSWNAWLSVKAPFVRRIMDFLRLAPANLLHVDRTGVDMVFDVRRPLPFADNFFRYVYASHLLEHLHFSEAVTLLHECWRVLAPGGIARFMVPDLNDMAGRYLAGECGEDGTLPADVFMRNLSVRSKTPLRGIFPYRIYSALKDFHSHKWMYDAASLIAHMREAGFADVREMQVGESAIPGIVGIEKNKGLCVEGRRL